MSKIYLDSYFSELLVKSNYTSIQDYCQFNNTNWLQTLPYDCDIVGVSFYTNRYHEYINLIQQILPRTKKLVINLSEPTDTSVLEFVQALKHPKIVFYSDIVVNEPANVKTNISWFIQPTNFYKEHDWAKEILSRILIPRSWEPRPHVYDCLLGQQRAHRNTIENYYNACDFKDKFIYSYYKKNIHQGLWDDLGGFKLNINVAVTEKLNVSRFAILPLDIYNKSYLSIVAETIASNRYSQFTEKIAKPILARRPFVVFCGQYYLRNLRQLGFKTFGDILDLYDRPVIDESYDTISDNKQRWTMAWREIERLKNADYDLFYAQIQHILDHNLMHFLCTDWHQEIKNEFVTD